MDNSNLDHAINSLIAEGSISRVLVGPLRERRSCLPKIIWDQSTGYLRSTSAYPYQRAEIKGIHLCLFMKILSLEHSIPPQQQQVGTAAAERKLVCNGWKFVGRYKDQICRVRSDEQQASRVEWRMTPTWPWKLLIEGYFISHFSSLCMLLILLVLVEAELSHVLIFCFKIRMITSCGPALKHQRC